MPYLLLFTDNFQLLTGILSMGSISMMDCRAKYTSRCQILNLYKPIFYVLQIQNVDYVKSLKDLDILVDTFEKKRDIIKSVDSWHKELKVKSRIPKR